MKTKRRYSVLRVNRRPVTNDPFRGPLSTSFGPLGASFGGLADAPPDVDVLELDAHELRVVGSEPNVAAIAPSMGMKLIEPVKAAEANAAGSAWGIGAVGAIASPHDGAGVTVAVLDTGIDAAHPAFAGVTLVQKDFTGTGNGDVHGHGTHCAATIFGRDVAGTRIGIARGVRRALIGKVLAPNGGSSDWLFRAIQWALDEGAQVISMSLGFDFPGMQAALQAQGWPAELATSAALEAYRGNLRMFDAIMATARARLAFDGGCLVVAASGNESQRNVHPNFEVAASLPSAADGVIAVGAVERAGGVFRIADFSNTLPQVSAPGVGILSAKAGGGLVSMSGTSMATPHVAGVAALWWEALRKQGNTLVTAPAVLAKLVATADAGVFAPDVDIADRGMGLVRCP